MTSAAKYAPYLDYKLHKKAVGEIDYQTLSCDKEVFINVNTFSLVIPAYNEEKRIRPFLEHLKAELPDGWEVIVVCDGTDSTADIVKSIDSRFKVIEFEYRLGKGGAIKAGLYVSHGDVLGYVDADGAISFSEVLKVFGAVKNDTPVAVGSRWVRGSKLERKQSIRRMILGRLYHYMSFALLGLTIKDTQCGLKSFKASMLKEVINSVTLRNLSFDTAILYHCQIRGINIAEVPIIWKDVKGSKVKPIKTALVMLLSLVGLRIANSKKWTLFDNVLRAVRDLVENA